MAVEHRAAKGGQVSNIEEKFKRDIFVIVDRELHTVIHLL